MFHANNCNKSSYCKWYRHEQRGDFRLRSYMTERNQKARFHEEEDSGSEGPPCTTDWAVLTLKFTFYFIHLFNININSGNAVTILEEIISNS